MASLTRRRVAVFTAVVMLLAGVLAVGRLGTAQQKDEDGGLPHAAREFLESSQGEIGGGAGAESQEARTAMEQFAAARTAPGIVAPGAYSAALGQLSSLGTVGGAWSDVTRVPYDADDPSYRSYWSNSSGGSGLVTGRITALAADADGHVYAGGADGGVWRSSQGGGAWTPIADGLPSLSSGDLEIAPDHSLWYATGEANTGGTSYVGSGVYRLADPTTGTFTAADRIGQQELESTTINALRFDGDGRVWAATLRGIWFHSTDPAHASDAWTLSYAPNPDYMPGGPLANANDSRNNAAYKNIVNDIAIDPSNANHLIAGIGWRSGDTYNGFYETTDRGATWTKVNLTGGLDKVDIGNVSFAWSGDGSKLYVVNQSPKLLNSGAAIQMTYLDGVYVSAKGTLAGPWTKIATADKLAASGSALSKNFGIGYRPGIQSWYNQFLLVDPSDPNHVFLGLEEVFETKDGGQHWSAVGPYWNFYFGCWSADSVYPPDGAPNGCPQTTHPDQHSVAVGTAGGHAYVFVGNDGGIYRRPLDGHVNRNGNATDWQSLNDGTIDALQYYAVGVGLKAAGNEGNPSGDSAGSGALVSGGLQDNGGSLVQVGAQKMVSPFGGDGGDILVDPNDGCRIVGEYVYLTMYMTKTCGNTHGDFSALTDPGDTTTITISPPDINARFIAPFAADAQNIDRWLAGGNSLWFQDKGFGITSGSEWTKVYTFADAGKVATAVAINGDRAIAAWCGTCNNAGFTRGVVVGNYANGAWTFAPVDLTGADAAHTVPNRYVGGVDVDAAGNLYLVMNGFSRRFTEGPGAGKYHVFRSTDGGATWATLDTPGGASFPDVPANSIKVLPSGGIVVGTDLGVLYLASGGTSWQRLGTGAVGSATAIPVTVAMDIELGPDGYIYAATHGRGIWRISAAGL
jgi:hypothetical protein